MSEKTKKMFYTFIIFNFCLVLLVGAFVFLDKRDFFDRFIICVPSQLLGFYCPFCGCTRSFYSLLRGDLYTAFRYNFVFPFFLVFFILKEAQALYAILKNQPKRFNLKGFKVFIILFLAYCATKNILLAFGIDMTGDFISSLF